MSIKMTAWLLWALSIHQISNEFFLRRTELAIDIRWNFKNLATQSILCNFARVTPPKYQIRSKQCVHCIKFIFDSISNLMIYRDEFIICFVSGGWVRNCVFLSFFRSTCFFFVCVYFFIFSYFCWSLSLFYSVCHHRTPNICCVCVLKQRTRTTFIINKLQKIMMMWIFASRSATDRNSQPSTIKTVLFVSLIGYYFMFVYMAEITKYFQFYNVKKCEWIFFLLFVFDDRNISCDKCIFGIGKRRWKKKQRQAKTHQTGKWKRRTKNPSTQSSIETAGQLDFAIIQNIRGGKCTCLQTVRYSHLLVQHISFFPWVLEMLQFLLFLSLSLTRSVWSGIDGSFDPLPLPLLFSFIHFIRSHYVHWRQVIHAVFPTNIVKYMANNTKKLSKTSHQAHICP